MKYMLFIYPDSTVAWTPEDRGSFPDQMRAWVAEMDAFAACAWTVMS
jgi:hypothetical protein